MPPLFDVRSIPVTEVARKRSRLFCQKCRWQVTPKHAYTLNPLKSEWADYAAVGRAWESKELTHNLSGTTQSQSSQLAEPLQTDLGLKSGISWRKLTFTLKKNVQAGDELSNILKKSSLARKKPLPV